MTKDILFYWCPYSAVALLGVGFGVRFMQLRNQLKCGEPRIATWSKLRSGRPFYSCLLLLAIGHLTELLCPRQVIAWNNSPVRLYLLEGILFVSGVLVLIGVLSIIARYLKHSSGSLVTQGADTMFLALLFVGVLSGLFTAAVYRWASAWTVVTLTPYVLSLVHAAPKVAYVTEMPFQIRLHVVCAFGCMAVFPLTSIAPTFMIALYRSGAFVFRPVASMVQQSVTQIEHQLRIRNPAPWLWPEEED